MDSTPPTRPRDSSPNPKHGIASQHATLGKLSRALHDRLAGERGGDALSLATQLELSLDAHFRVEEQVLFPTLREQQPELADRIDALLQEHDRTRQQLRQLQMCIGTEQWSQAAEVLAGVRALLDTHETREEAYFESLAPPGAPSGSDTPSR